VLKHLTVLIITSHIKNHTALVGSQKKKTILMKDDLLQRFSRAFHFKMLLSFFDYNWMRILTLKLNILTFIIKCTCYFHTSSPSFDIIFETFSHLGNENVKTSIIFISLPFSLNIILRDMSRWSDMYYLFSSIACYQFFKNHFYFGVMHIEESIIWT